MNIMQDGFFLLAFIVAAIVVYLFVKAHKDKLSIGAEFQALKDHFTGQIGSLQTTVAGVRGQVAQVVAATVPLSTPERPTANAAPIAAAQGSPAAKNGPVSVFGYAPTLAPDANPISAALARARAEPTTKQEQPMPEPPRDPFKIGPDIATWISIAHPADEAIGMGRVINWMAAHPELPLSATGYEDAYRATVVRNEDATPADQAVYDANQNRGAARASGPVFARDVDILDSHFLLWLVHQPGAGDAQFRLLDGTVGEVQAAFGQWSTSFGESLQGYSPMEYQGKLRVYAKAFWPGLGL